jgi:hypothetical protein
LATSPPSLGSGARLRYGDRLPRLEGLEDRVLLSGNPTGSHFNGDGVVNRKDVTAIHSELQVSGGAKPTISDRVDGLGAGDVPMDVRHSLGKKPRGLGGQTLGAVPAPAMGPWPSRVFPPYVDMTDYPTYNLTGAMSMAAIKDFTLGFIVADPKNHKPSWGGCSTDDINGGAFDMAVRSQVSAVRQQGGDVMVSFGGEAGEELAQVITNVRKLEGAYQSVITEKRKGTGVNS